MPVVKKRDLNSAVTRLWKHKSKKGIQAKSLISALDKVWVPPVVVPPVWLMRSCGGTGQIDLVAGMDRIHRRNICVGP